MLKWWTYAIIALFLIDLIYRTFFERKIDIKKIKDQKISNTNIDDNDDLNVNNTNIKKNFPTNYNKNNFDPEIIHYYSQHNEKKYLDNFGDENDDDEDNDLVYSKDHKRNEIIDEDEIEFRGLIPQPKKRINITIEYDDKYQNLYDELSKQLDGNITYLSFYPKLSVIDGYKKILRYVLFFSMGLCCLCFVFIEKIIQLCCSNMPDTFKGFLSIIKYFLSGGAYLFHMYIIKKISHKNLFEVYVNQNLKYSTFKKDEPPSYIILFNIIKNMQNNE
jgi:hypothetical protein